MGNSGGSDEVRDEGYACMTLVGATPRTCLLRKYGLEVEVMKKVRRDHRIVVETAW